MKSGHRTSKDYSFKQISNNGKQISTFSYRFAAARPNNTIPSAVTVIGICYFHGLTRCIPQHNGQKFPILIYLYGLVHFPVSHVIKSDLQFLCCHIFCVVLVVILLFRYQFACTVRIGSIRVSYVEKCLEYCWLMYFLKSEFDELLWKLKVLRDFL